MYKYLSIYVSISMSIYKQIYVYLNIAHSMRVSCKIGHPASLFAACKAVAASDEPPPKPPARRCVVHGHSRRDSEHLGRKQSRI